MWVNAPLLAAAATLLLLCAACVAQPLSRAVQGAAATEHLDDNKYRRSTSLDPGSFVFQDLSHHHTDYHEDKDCDFDLQMVWHKKIKSKIFTTPIIADLFSDGSKEIIIASTTDVELLEAENGEETPGWPFPLSRARLMVDPLLYDIDHDGNSDVVVFTKDAHILFLDEGGEVIHDATLRIPPAIVEKTWYEGLQGPHMRPTLSLLAKRQDNPTERKLMGLETSVPFRGPNRVFTDFGGDLPEEGVKSLELFLRDDMERLRMNRAPEQVFVSYQYEDYLMQAAKTPEGMIEVDPHVMSTPTIAAVAQEDGTTKDLLVVPVSYYFDPVVYADPEEMGRLGASVDISKYVASGVVAFDLNLRKIEFASPLDLTTVDVSPAHVTTTPQVADMDRDGTPEIVVASGIGHIYILDIRGVLETKLSMGPISQTPALFDCNKDSVLDIIAVDDNSNVVCFNLKGEAIWERRMAGLPTQHPQLADLDGDNSLEVVVATTAGIFIFDAHSGTPFQKSPIKTAGSVYSPISFVHLDGPQAEARHAMMVFQSWRGLLHVVDARRGCSDKIDLEAYTYSKVLVDDMTGNGYLDLLVATNTGDVYCIATNTPFHPLKTIQSHAAHMGGVFQRFNYFGIAATVTSRVTRDVRGTSFPLTFEIHDARCLDTAGCSYKVKVIVGGHAQELYGTFSAGTHTVTVPTDKRGPATVQLVIHNENQQATTDSFALSFNVYFYKPLKW
eukprot:CAMPEP_0177686876 /NCGR_PEP_ID=MMETSP0447-20121125/33810_1 /TAXON_ID=0 /ORGANISM="Stygamoeba regulata, Strain BSH-02190019" /LENGTH=726 /DNA_ID=CAMNT_0019197043 /DNA_START=39 /DNA_END=2216 /DNA_ORIENTATION=+